VIKLIKKGWMEHLEAYKKHCIDQAVTILTAGHDIKCMFATPKLLEALANALGGARHEFPETGITGIFSGGTEFTPQWTRFCVEEYFGGPPEESGVYMTPTYGNTLMGLACSKPVTAADGYKISYYAPQPRAVIEVVDFDDRTRSWLRRDRRVKLTTLTKEFFVPGLPGTGRRRTRTAVRKVPLGRQPATRVSFAVDDDSAEEFCTWVEVETPVAALPWRSGTASQSRGAALRC
jgi:hypothetical protein